MEPFPTAEESKDTVVGVPETWKFEAAHFPQDVVNQY